MPHGKTKFNDGWLRKEDTQGFLVGQWCKADECNTQGFCILCKKTFSVDNSGFKQVLAHSGGTKHQALARARFSSTQCHFKLSETVTSSYSTVEESPGPSTSKPVSSTVACLDKCTKDLVTQSELLWGMKVSQSNYSYRSCDDLPSLFKKIFPGNVVAENFTMSRSKVSYLISDGLGPYFKKDLCMKVSASPGYVIQYDETANSQVRKQCDILIRYWSEEKNRL